MPKVKLIISICIFSILLGVTSTIKNQTRIIEKDINKIDRRLAFVEKDLNETFIEYMLQNEIATPFHYIPLHSSPAGKVFGRSHGKLSITDDLSSRLVRLPSYFTLSENNIEYIIKKVLYYFE